jgi:hypothetical protein
MKLKLTQERYESIPALLERGMDREKIAAQFGVTANTLQVQCSRRGISLRSGGRLRRRCIMSLPEAPLDLSDRVMVALREKARLMGVDEVRLASDLLETIVTEDLYNAVLDFEETA